MVIISNVSPGESLKKPGKKIWIPACLILGLGFLFFYNRPVEFQKAVLMSTPLIFKDGLARPYEELPDDIRPRFFEVFYATDRKPSDISIINPVYYGNSRSFSLSLGTASVGFGDEAMDWLDIEKESLKTERNTPLPLKIEGVSVLNSLGNTLELENQFKKSPGKEDRFIASVKERLSNSATSSIYIFVPGFKSDFTYPVLVAAELWHYMGYPGAFIAYSWPSSQRLRDYFSDVETTAFTAQHFRMLLLYLAQNSGAGSINILSYSAGARIVSQALHELSLMAHGNPGFKHKLKINQVIFAAPDIDTMLFQGRYRDGFENIANNFTIYTNANDTALNWALRFLGWPRLGAPGEMGLTPEDLHPFKTFDRTDIIDVAAAENAASGNGHGYFIKSPWVSTDLILTLKYGARPPARGLTREKGGSIWEFSQIYPRLLEQIILKNR